MWQIAAATSTTPAVSIPVVVSAFHPRDTAKFESATTSVEHAITALRCQMVLECDFTSELPIEIRVGANDLARNRQLFAQNRVSLSEARPIVWFLLRYPHSLLKDLIEIFRSLPLIRRSDRQDSLLILLERAVLYRVPTQELANAVALLKHLPERAIRNVLNNKMLWSALVEFGAYIIDAVLTALHGPHQPFVDVHEPLATPEFMAWVRAICAGQHERHVRQELTLKLQQIREQIAIAMDREPDDYQVAVECCKPYIWRIVRPHLRSEANFLQLLTVARTQARSNNPLPDQSAWQTAAARVQCDGPAIHAARNKVFMFNPTSSYPYARSIATAGISLSLSLSQSFCTTLHSIHSLFID